ncbi:MAG: GntR family transcriptional regulator [Nocardioides sp.]
MSLDPDDPRPPYQQVAAALRAAILTRTVAPGDKLPSQTELARTYGVARMTIQQALRLLKDEGLTVSRQGSGVFARTRTERPVGLRPHIERAFDQQHVRIDFCGYTAETLHGVIGEPLDMVRLGRLTPSTIRLRLLLSDMTQPLALPVIENCSPEESAAARDRMVRIAVRHTGAISEAVGELADLGLIEQAAVEIRLYGATPLFMCYVINDTDAFFGYYPVVRHLVQLDGQRVATFDPMGKDAVLFQHTDDGDPDSTESQFVQQTRAWFESIWDTIAKPADDD